MQDICRHIWQNLTAGAGPGQSPFTMWQLASNGADGVPQLRTIVLRGADEQRNTLTFHTDMRSAKVAELRADPRLSMLAVDLVNLKQIRLEGRAEICTDDNERKAIWNSARPHTLILYQAALPPGTPLESPLPTGMQRPAEDNPGHRSGFDNFCVIHVTLSKIDYLDISADGHQRTLFNRQEGAWHGLRVAP